MQQSTRNTISSHLGHHHRELDERLRDYQQSEADGDEAAQRYWSDFEQGLRQHIAWEEELLFPLFEERTGWVIGPTAVMRTEHRQITELLDQIRKSSVEGRANDELVKCLSDRLATHNRKEETVLYPWIDRLLTETESDALLVKMPC